MARKTIDDLYKVIIDRKNNPCNDSYTVSLFRKGKDEILKKLGEEAVEVIIASALHGRVQLIHELADLFYHLLVLMAEEGIRPEDVNKELERRAKGLS